MTRPLPPSERWPAREREIRARRVTLASGLRLRVVEGGPPAGVPVVLVHGWGGSAHQFSRNIPALAARGLRVHALDLPGHGLSEKPDHARYYSVHSLVDVLRELLDAMGLDRAAIVGQSLGGLLSLRLAIDAPERVAQLALISAIGLVEPVVVGRYARLIPEAFAGIMPTLAIRPVFSAVMRLAYGAPERPTARDVDEAWAATSDAAYPRALLHMARTVRWTPPTVAELAGLAMPLLVIAGERDRIAPPRRIGTLLDGVRGARLVIVPGGGHVVNEGNSTVVNPLMGEFLTSGVA